MKNTIITLLAVLSCSVVFAGAGEAEKFPLDWRYSRLEPGVPMLDAESVKKAEAMPSGLMGRVVTTAKLKSTDVVGDTSKKTLSLSAWRNERVNGQVVLWSKNGVEQVRFSCSELVSDSGSKIDASAVNARFVRYVLGGDKLYPDVLDPVKRIDVPAGGYRPLWLTVSVPKRVKPGVYKGAITVKGVGCVDVDFPIELNVLKAVLPDPDSWEFFLDLWQHPWAIARYHRVEPFSKEHYALLKPILTELAQAGQKTLTTSIVEKPWNQQTFDPYDSMIKHVKMPMEHGPSISRSLMSM